MHLLMSLREVFQPNITRIIIASVLMIPFVYLITLKDKGEEEEVTNDATSRSEMYHSLYSQLVTNEEKPVVEMKQSDLAV
jgi:hypothetical protein